MYSYALALCQPGAAQGADSLNLRDKYQRRVKDAEDHHSDLKVGCCGSCEGSGMLRQMQQWARQTSLPELGAEYYVSLVPVEPAEALEGQLCPQSRADDDDAGSEAPHGDQAAGPTPPG